MNSWNYEELGFRSQNELDESIARVKETKVNPKNDLELRDYNRRKTNEYTTSTGGLDFKGLEEGARLAELDREVARKLYWEKEAERQRAEQEEVSKLMRATADTITDEAKEEAEKELRKQKAKADEELQKEIYLKHNVKTDKEIEEENSYKEMLKGLKL